MLEVVARDRRDQLDGVLNVSCLLAPVSVLMIHIVPLTRDVSWGVDRTYAISMPSGLQLKNRCTPPDVIA